MNYVPAVITLMLIYVTSLLGLTTPQQQEWYLYYTSFFLGIHLFFLMLYHKNWNQSAFLFVGGIGATALLLEFLATQFNLYGASYDYGSTLSDSIFGALPIMIMYWIIIIYSSCSLAAKATILKNDFLKAGVSALLSLFLVVLFQQIASPFELWHLDTNWVYLVIWAVITALFQLLFQKLKLDYSNRMSVYIYGGLVVFLVGVIFFLKQ